MMASRLVAPRLGCSVSRMALRLPVPRSGSSRIIPIAPIRTSAAFRCLRSFSSSRSLQHPDVFHAQREDPAAAAILASLESSTSIPQTLTEKIVQRYSVGLPKDKRVKSGDYVTISPHRIMTHDNSWPVASKFMSIGASKIKDSKQVVMTLDHDVQNKSEKNLQKYAQIEKFAKTHGVDFYPAGRGIGHQIMVEEGYAWPGTLVVASDSHSNMYGGVGCLGTPVVRTDAASIWATGKTWWQIPPIAQVQLTGVLPKGVTGKDVIVALCGLFGKDEVLNHAIEFTGPEETMRSLQIDDRLTIANMTTEWGALAGLWPVDAVLKGWLRAKATTAAMWGSTVPGLESSAAERFTHPALDELFEQPLVADKGAQYAKRLHLDLSTLSPYVSGPNSVKVATPINELEPQSIKVDKAYVVSCTNSRASDIAAAAKVFKEAAEKNGGKVPKIADGVRFYIAAASIPEQYAAEEAGDWQTLIEAGAQPLPAGCGPCIGLGAAETLLQPGEVGISASNRNFKGRMGSTDAKAYLASPEVVAASALNGTISGPGWYQKPEGWTGVVRGEGDAVKQDGMMTAEEALEKVIGQIDNIVAEAEKTFAVEDANDGADAETDVYPGFPERVSGEIIFCDADSLNTDAIYPGKYTYQDNITFEQMGAYCMENYDTGFSSVAKPGDILVSGFNFGCGSSREQAATAILSKGIPLVVAGSFGNIFSRNSINNALMGLEVPRLISRLREKFGNSKTLTQRTGWTLTWDVRRSRIEVQEGPEGEKWTQKVGEMPPNVQEIVAMGGLESWVRNAIKSS